MNTRQVKVNFELSAHAGAEPPCRCAPPQMDMASRAAAESRAAFEEKMKEVRIAPAKPWQTGDSPP